jgi:hypothetical protein
MDIQLFTTLWRVSQLPRLRCAHLPFSGLILRTFQAGLDYLATCDETTMDRLEIQLGDSKTSFPSQQKRMARKRTRRGWHGQESRGLFSERAGFPLTESGVLGESGIHINGVHGALIWRKVLFAAIIKAFSICFWLVAGASVEREGDTGASLFFSSILLPVPHRKVAEPLQGTRAYASLGGWPSVLKWC